MVLCCNSLISFFLKELKETQRPAGKNQWLVFRPKEENKIRIKLDWISSKQTQWVFWYTCEFSASFTLSLSNICIFILLVIYFAQLSPDSAITSRCPFHSYTYCIVHPVCITQLSVFVYFVYVQKSIIEKLLFIFISVFFLISTNFPSCHICF